MRILRKDVNLKIQEVYTRDPLVARLRKEQQNADILTFKNKTYLPQEYIEEVIKEHYNDLLQGYLGITKILEIIGKTYARPKIREEVKNYIKKYVLY